MTLCFCCILGIGLFSAKEFITSEESKKKISIREKQKDSMYTIESGKNVLIVVPTGYGKTLPAIFAVLHTKAKGLVTIWLAPLKSLTNEQMETLKKYVGERVLIVTGDFRENKKKILSGQYDVVIMTYEMLNIMMANKKKRAELMARVGCIVIDEAHNVCEGERGAKLESTFHISDRFHPTVQKVLLSATIGNYEQFGKWLNAEVIYAPPSERPVPLEKQIIPFEKERNAKINYDSKLQLLKRFLDQQYQKKPKIIIFCSSRQRCIDIVNELNGYHSLVFAFHHAGLMKDQRKEVEEKFATKVGGIDVIVATPTLAQGVNTPTDICILFDVTRWNWRTSSEEFISRNEMIQMIGRAGRFGISKFGLAVALCGHNEVEMVEDMWNNALIINSQIPSKIDLVALQWVVAGIENKDDLIKSYNQLYTEEENLDEEMFVNTLGWLKDKRFILEDEENNYVASNLGRLTTYMAVRPRTALHFLAIKNDIDRDDISLYELFHRILNTEEFTDNIVVRNTRSDGDCIMIGQRFLGNNVDDRICKAFAMTFNEFLSETFKTPRVPAGNADIFVLKEASGRIINACSVILGSRLEHVRPRLDLLNKAISMGALDEEILNLTKLKGIGTTRAIRLKKAGIRSIEQFVEMDTGELRRIMGRISEEKVEEAKASAFDVMDEGQPPRVLDDDDPSYFDFTPSSDKDKEPTDD